MASQKLRALPNHKLSYSYPNTAAGSNAKICEPYGFEP